jgi:hypothetical protein
VVAFAVAVVSHATALGGGAIWLDHAHFEQGLALAAPSGWPALFTRGFAGTGFYRPLAALSFSIDASLWNTPLFFHVVTLAWHGAASCLVLAAGHRLGLSRRAALAAAVLFAVHPLTSIVASANAFRSEAMMAVCLLGLLVAHLARRPGWAAAAMLGGALTKETAWLLAPLFILGLELRRGRAEAGEPAPRKLLLAELVAFVVATSLHTAYAPPFRARHFPLALSEAVGTRLAALAKSALAVLIPSDRWICDAFPVTAWTNASALCGLLLLVGVAALAVRRGRLGLLFGISLLPSLQLVPVMRWWSPHYLYLPLAFGAMLVAAALEGQRRSWLAPVVASALAVLSLKEGLRYRSDARLWAPEVAHEPACREGQFYLGEVARIGGDLETAARRYEQAAAPVPGVLAYADETAALANLGAIRFAQERYDEARAVWTSARLRSRDEDERRGIVHNLAALALARGDAPEALRALESEIGREDARPESLLIEAKALHALGREPEAVALLQRLGLAPSDAGHGR